MKIQSVEIKGFHNIDSKEYQFQDINYIIGPNGIGKTSILQAIQWGILGHIPGTNKTKAAIFQHAKDRDMSVKITFDDDTKVFRRYYKSGESIKEELIPADWEDSKSKLLQDIDLPIWDTSEFLSLTANKMKDWFINFLPKSQVEINWFEELKASAPTNMLEDDVQTELRSIQTYIDSITGLDMTTTEIIQNVNTFCKEKVKYHKETLDRLESTIKTILFYDDVDFDPSRLSLIESEIENLNKTKSEIHAQQQIIDQTAGFVVALDAELSSLESLVGVTNITADTASDLISAEAQKLNTEMKQVNKDMSELDAQISDIESQIFAANQQYYGLQSNIDYESKVLTSEGKCPYTSEDCNSLQQSIDSAKKRISTYKRAQTTLKKKTEDLEAKHLQLLADKSTAGAVLTNNSNKLTQLGKIEARISELGSKIVNIAEIPDPKSIENIDTQIQQLLDQKTKMFANQKYSESVDRYNKSKIQINNQIDIWKAWSKHTDVNGMQSRILETDSPFKLLETYMYDKYISVIFDADTHVKFDFAGGANSFSFGLIRDNVYVPYVRLSSGEKCIYIIALMSAILHVKANTDTYIMLIDDILDHLDDARMQKLFNCILADDLQILFAGIKSLSSMERVNIIELK